MPQTISKIGIKNSSGTGYDTRDIGAKGQNVEIGYDASNKVILDVDTQTPATTKQLTKVLQDTENNISNLNKNKAPNSHAWSDADSGVNHGLADGTHYGHIKVGNGLTVNSGKVDVAYGDSANTACQGNDSRLSNARKNPNAVTFSNGTTNTTYDGSSAKTVTAATVGAAPAGHTTINATNSILGHVKTGTGITNSSGTISVSYGTAAGTACQGNDSRLSDSRTPKSHAATATTYGSGTSSNYGHVKLTDTYSVTTPNASTNGANTGIAASAYALQQAYNTLNSKLGKFVFGRISMSIPARSQPYQSQSISSLGLGWTPTRTNTIILLSISDKTDTHYSGGNPVDLFTFIQWYSDTNGYIIAYTNYSSKAHTFYVDYLAIQTS